MTRQRWKLTQATPGRPEVDTYGEPIPAPPRQDRQPCPETCSIGVCVNADPAVCRIWLGLADTEHPAAERVSLLALMASDPRNGLVEVAPGVYRSVPDVWH